MLVVILTGVVRVIFGGLNPSILDSFSVILLWHHTVVWHWEPVMLIWAISSQGPFGKLSMKFLECVDMTPSGGRYQIWIYLHTSTWHKHVLPLSAFISNILVPSLLISAALLSDCVCLTWMQSGSLRSLQRVKKKTPNLFARRVCSARGAVQVIPTGVPRGTAV